MMNKLITLGLILDLIPDMMRSAVNLFGQITTAVLMNKPELK